MNRFIKYILKLFVGSILIVWSLSLFLDYYYTHMHRRFVTDLKDRDYTVLFLGNSRCMKHLNPYLFDSITKEKSMNLGVSGANLPDMYAILKIYNTYNKLPKYCYIQIDTFSHQSVPSNTAKGYIVSYLDQVPLNFYSQLLPENEKLRFPFAKYTLFPQINYREFLISLFKNNPIDNNQTKRGWATSKSITGYSLPKKDSIMYGFTLPGIDSIQNYCKQLGIQLRFFVAPIYRNNIRFVNQTKSIIYNDASLYKDHYLFYNINHLNVKGASDYTKYFSMRHVEEFTNSNSEH